MKAGIGIGELVKELQDQAKMQKDFMAPSDKMAFAMAPVTEAAEVETPEPVDVSALSELLSKIDMKKTEQAMADAIEKPHLVIPEQGVYLPNAICHGQFANKLKIPKAYYDRMLEHRPELLTRNVNEWLHFTEGEEQPANRMVRTLGRTARALLSDKYRRIDHLPLMQSVVEQLEDLGVTTDDIVSCDVTDSRLYLKVLTPKLEGEVNVGDVVQAGLVVSNSEVGQGSVAVNPLIYRLSCKNGMVMEDRSMRRRHVGSRHTSEDDESWRLYSDETLKKDDDALFAKVNDLVKGALTEEVFATHLSKLKAADGQKVEAKKPDVVEVLSKKFSLSEAEQSSVLDNFIESGNFSRWSLSNAVTLASQTVESYDRATELERVGGRIIEMPESAWASIARAQAA